MKKILIIEDDQNIALALSIRLKAHGYTTWTASDGIMAITMAVQNKPDLILLDISLPGGNGFALTEQLKHLPETRRTPIVLTTASHDPELRKKALDLGTCGLLRKPYDAEELARTIEEAFGRPEQPAPEAPRAAEGHVNGKSEPPKAKKILIVEDDQKIATGLAVRMKAAGFEPIVANDGLTGIRSAANHRPDLVLLDVSLPAGDGFGVAEGIQRNIPVPIPIIFLTASKLPELRRRAQQLGAVGFFEKPYEARSLVAAVREALTINRAG